jgi:Spy/CpxP family protein refolding chaperone
MKLLFSFLLMICFVGFAGAQAKEVSTIDYVKTEIKKVEGFLAKQNSKLKLTNAQRDQLTKIFETKKISSDLIIAKEKSLSKVEISNAMTKLENEYKDKIESIMDVEQRVAYQKIKKSQLLPEAKMN